MKIVAARLNHETNTFSPVPTPLARFATGTDVPPEGAAAVAAYKGTGSAIKSASTCSTTGSKRMARSQALVQSMPQAANKRA